MRPLILRIGLAIAYLADTSPGNFVRGGTCNFPAQLQNDDRPNGFFDRGTAGAHCLGERVPSANNALATACVARNILGPCNYLALVAKHCPVLYPSSSALLIVLTAIFVVKINFLIDLLTSE